MFLKETNLFTSIWNISLSSSRTQVDCVELDCYNSRHCHFVRSLSKFSKTCTSLNIYSIIKFVLNDRLDADLPTSSRLVDDSVPFNKIGYSSFGKASICSSFSVKSSGSSSTTGKENLDSLLKTISKDPHTSMNMQDSLNDVNSIRYISNLHNIHTQIHTHTHITQL